jgi:hypothetical protein
MFVDLGDGRTAWAKRWNDLVITHANDLGGYDMLSEAQRSICKRASAIECELEAMEGRMATSQPIEIAVYARLTGVLARLLERYHDLLRGPSYREAMGERGGEDPAALVVSLNLYRRNLNKGQMAMGLAFIYPESQQDPELLKKLERLGKSRHAAEQRLSQARAVLSYSPELALQARDGATTLVVAHAHQIPRSDAARACLQSLQKAGVLRRRTQGRGADKGYVAGPGRKGFRQ